MFIDVHKFRYLVPHSSALDIKIHCTQFNYIYFNICFLYVESTSVTYYYRSIDQSHRMKPCAGHLSSACIPLCVCVCRLRNTELTTDLPHIFNACQCPEYSSYRIFCCVYSRNFQNLPKMPRVVLLMFTTFCLRVLFKTEITFVVQSTWRRECLEVKSAFMRVIYYYWIQSIFNAQYNNITILPNDSHSLQTGGVLV